MGVERTPQEEPPIIDPPKWDGTPTPSVHMEDTSPVQEDDEIPLKFDAQQEGLNVI